MLVCSTDSVDSAPEGSPTRQEGRGTTAVRRSSSRLASTPDKPKTVPLTTNTTSSTSQKEKYLGIGVLVDTKDDKGNWSEARIIDVNPTARVLKVHYQGWHKRYDAWVPLTSVVAHGSKVKGVSATAKSLKQTNLRVNLFRPNPYYVEKSPSKATKGSKDDGGGDATSFAFPDKASEISGAEVVPRTSHVADKAKTKRISPRTLIASIEHEGGADEEKTPSSSSQQQRVSPRLESKAEKRPPTSIKDAKETRASKSEKTIQLRSERKAKKTTRPDNEKTKPQTATKATKSKKNGSSEGTNDESSKITTPTKPSMKAKKEEDVLKTGVPTRAKKTKDTKRQLDVEDALQSSPLKKARVENIPSPKAKQKNSHGKGSRAKSAPLPSLPMPPPSTPSDSKPTMSKSALAEIFRNRVREQQHQIPSPRQKEAPVAPGQMPPFQYPIPSDMYRKQARNANLLYMQQQDAYLRDSIEKWAAQQQELARDVTSVVLL
ncbi:Aste57867_9695 [Aphanomyces stellatus]|uniref:Aste57867_9695 protein n=1 Tax=Aphanomyces stellatus TaxID=120398 RepID=A0A485KNV5_9STRA|nr:hypothetical protein As57867_009657 [Aphanomyces stellatus]VFT86574.1 Aste57867_9695 [Aphanomyces stellatus]